MIVDDDYYIRELYEYVFTDLGYQVETAENGKDGLEKAVIFRPDCMLIDINMPEMTGAEFAEKLRGSPDPGRKNIPFVAMTGENCLETSIHHALRDNPSCKALLPKMTSPNSVAQMVQAILKPGK